MFTTITSHRVMRAACGRQTRVQEGASERRGGRGRRGGPREQARDSRRSRRSCWASTPAAQSSRRAPSRCPGPGCRDGTSRVRGRETRTRPSAASALHSVEAIWAPEKWREGREGPDPQGCREGMEDARAAHTPETGLPGQRPAWRRPPSPRGRRRTRPLPAHGGLSQRRLWRVGGQAGRGEGRAGGGRRRNQGPPGSCPARCRHPRGRSLGTFGPHLTCCSQEPRRRLGTG